MHKKIFRLAQRTVQQYLEIFPVVVILGPRQCGKSTLVKMMSEGKPNFVHLDLQNISDLNKLTEPSLFFESNEDKVICLDEIQLAPELFAALRSEVDRNRRNGRFILLGSASRDLVQKTAESLAGRAGFIELTPFTNAEICQAESFSPEKFWVRGGFPDSFLAQSDESSAIWRENFLRAYLEWDIPQLGFQIPVMQLRRFLTMCAHSHAQTLNLSKLAESINLTHPTIRRYVDLLEQTFILRSLQPYEGNLKKRLVKSPKVYIRDSGILHSLLHIGSFNDLLGNPSMGASWEGFVIENIIAQRPGNRYYFYRTATGSEVDLVVECGNKIIAVECKASTAPQLSKGSWQAFDDVQPDKVAIIAPVKDSYLIKERVEVTNITLFVEQYL